MLDQKNAENLVEIARHPESNPSTRISACALIYKCSLLPANEVLSILQATVDDFRCKDGNRIKAYELMDKIDSSRSNETSLTPEQRKAVEQQLLSEYLDVETDASSREVQKPADIQEV